ncbi:MAG: hypothetical protein ACPGYX_04880 [Oceanobacter sp.]
MPTSGIILITPQSSQQPGNYLALPEFEAAVRNAQLTCLPTFVVLEKSNGLWENKLIEMGIPWGVCPDADKGVEHSIAYGVHCNQDWTGWVIDIATPPFTPTDLYQSLGEAARTFKVATHAPSDHPSDPGRSRSHSLPIAFNSSLGFKLLDPTSGLIPHYLDPYEKLLPESKASWQQIRVQGTVTGTQ